MNEVKWAIEGQDYNKKKILRRFAKSQLGSVKTVGDLVERYGREQAEARLADLLGGEIRGQQHYELAPKLAAQLVSDLLVVDLADMSKKGIAWHNLKRSVAAPLFLVHVNKPAADAKGLTRAIEERFERSSKALQPPVSTGEIHSSSGPVTYDVFAEVDAKLSLGMKDVLLPYLTKEMGLKVEQLPDVWSEHELLEDTKKALDADPTGQMQVEEQMKAVYESDVREGQVKGAHLGTELAASYYLSEAAAILDEGQRPDPAKLAEHIEALSERLREHNKLETLDTKRDAKAREESRRTRIRRRMAYHAGIK